MRLSTCLITTILLAAAAPARAQSSMQIFQHAYLLPSDINPYQQFGISVDIDGDTLIVGSGTDEDGGLDSGSAYVFVRNGLGWVEEQKLLSTPNEAYYHTGTAVAVEGDVAVVGAPNLFGNGPGGAAFVFERVGGVWTQTAMLTPIAPPSSFAYFGTALDVSGGRIFVGAPETGWPGTFYEDQGSVYVYGRSGGAWVLETRVRAGDGQHYDAFGATLSVSGDTLLVGAPVANVAGSGVNRPGAAYVFVDVPGQGWTQEAKLGALAPVANENFALSVALDGDLAAIGSPEHVTSGFYRAGCVEVKRRSAGTWTHEAQLFSQEPTQDQAFGRRVAVSGPRILAGAPGCYAGNHVFSSCFAAQHGYALVFEHRAGRWTEMVRCEASNGTTEDQFGSAAAIRGDLVAVGAVRRWEWGIASGSVYTTDLGQRFETYCTPAPNSAGPGALIGAVGTLSVSADDLTLTCTGLPPGSVGKFYYGPNRTEVPFGNGYRCVSGGAYRLYPTIPADAFGFVSRPLDLTQGPPGSGSGQILPGSTWCFQYWHRNAAAGGAGFNLSDAFAATFVP
jgi:hypothetical protein